MLSLAHLRRTPAASRASAWSFRASPSNRSHHHVLWRVSCVRAVPSHSDEEDVERQQVVVTSRHRSGEERPFHVFPLYHRISGGPHNHNFNRSAFHASAPAFRPQSDGGGFDAFEADDDFLVAIEKQLEQEMTNSIMHAGSLDPLDTERMLREGKFDAAELGLGTEAKGKLDAVDSLFAENHRGLAPLSDKLREQWKLEEWSMDVAVKDYMDSVDKMKEKNLSSTLSPSRRLISRWFQPLCDAIREEQELARNMVKGKIDRIVYGPYLVQLPPEKLAVITLHETLGQLQQQPDVFGARFVRLSVAIGTMLKTEVDLQRLKLLKKSRPDWARRNLDVMTPRVLILMSKKHLQNDGHMDWPHDIRAKLGAVLLEMLIATARIENEDGDVVPAFFHSYKFAGYRRIGTISAIPAVHKEVERGHVIRATMHPRFLPMLTPPEPWSAYNNGGYLRLRCNLMRIRGSNEQLDALRVSEGMQLVFDGLNILAKTEWKINKRVHDVVLDAWESGGGLADLPSKSDVPIPPMPEEEGVLALWRKEAWRAKRTNFDRHSLRCDLEHKLTVAEKFRDYDKFYFPHNLDFRGRAYPIPPHLNHLGADVCRGLLTFANSKPLGERGLFWLKVHLANLCGFDKGSFDQRIEWVETNMEHIIDSAKRPMSGRRWWSDSENPWQTLACCFELVDALESPDPSEYKCSLPIHQDGSCNGLQHYAALGRDLIGGTAVNLTASEIPQDVYSGVAELLQENLEKEAEAGDELAILLKDKVSRKVVKQTVMTSVYGVTLIGAREQITNRLEELGSIDPRMVQPASLYLAKHTLAALQQMFSGAKDIMNWLAESARLIAKDDAAVSWVTPLGLPVVQPYRKQKQRIVRTVVQMIALHDTEDTPVAKQKQRTAFPPNYVHSLDGAHMLKTAISCADQGLEFAAVHDSFWTHARDVDTMNVVIREEFIDLHNRPLLEDLLKQFRMAHPDIEFPPLPQRGELDIEQVRHSDFFFD